MRTHLLLAPLLLGACASPRPADDLPQLLPPQQPMPGPPPPMQAPRPSNYLDFMFGTSYWDNLGSLDPSGVSPFPGAFGEFDDWGFAFTMGYDRVVRRGERTDWTLGMEVGWSTFENDGAGLVSPSTTLSSSLFYVAPVTRVMWHVSPRVSLSAGVGAGYYAFSIDEYDTYYYGYWWGYSGRTLNQDSAFGGFVSAGVDFNLSPGSAIRIDNKVHFVEFDGLQSLMPNETSVSGPIWTFEVGFVLAF